MNTNGGIRTTDWWTKLAQTLNQPRDYVVFSIDGLADTNHIYRVNVNWHNVMANAQAFIQAGGSAHWDMLVYEHNEHQVDAAAELAQSMGFRWFRAKVSKRPLVSGLKPPVNWARPVALTGDIRCHALSEQSLYLNAQGRVSPCCWLGSRQKDFVSDFNEIIQSWADQPHPVCATNCSSAQNNTNFTQQWQKNIELQLN
jgi:sulfatase maturation enzyme AslB (radical SAM superfamily)